MVLGASVNCQSASRTLLTERFGFYFFTWKGRGVCITAKKLPCRRAQATSVRCPVTAPASLRRSRVTRLLGDGQMPLVLEAGPQPVLSPRLLN